MRPHAVVSTTAGGQFSYDANGNMTSRRITTTAGVQTLTWTVENRLQRVTVGGATKADFDYDADGVRVRRFRVLCYLRVSRQAANSAASVSSTALRACGETTPSIVITPR